MQQKVVIGFSAVMAGALLCQWLAWRVRLPAIIFLLLAGILAGPVLGLLDPEPLLGDLFFPFVSLSVAVILFEGSLTLRFEEVRGLQRVIRRMLSLGVLTTWVITALATRLVLGFSWEVSCLFGAVMVVTGPTVIVPMLRTVRPTAAVANILRWEGILIDPIGAILAVLVFEFVLAGEGGGGLGAGLLMLVKISLVGGALGIGAGQFLGVALRREWLPDYLRNMAALCLVCLVFTLSNSIELESGLLTVTVMGVWLANMRGVDLEDILGFKENLSVFLISLLFIMLSARLDIAQLEALGWPALVVFAVIQLLARPLNVQLSALGSGLPWPERHLLAWIAPRGIVAAAISALFAMKLEALGYADAELMVPLAFLVIIGTVVLQSATARPLALWLGVAAAPPKGVFILGANVVARMVGRALRDNGVRVLLADTGWSGISDARMNEQLPTYYGNPASERAERYLDLTGYGKLLALTPNEHFNELVLRHLRRDMGDGNLFTVGLRPLRQAPEEGVRNRRPQTLFGGPLTYARLVALLGEGYTQRTTQLTEKYGFAEYRRSGGIPLFALDPQGELRVFTAEQELEPGAGWKVIGLGPREHRQQAAI